MYPPTHAKVPPVRPRSSLSSDEHHHRIKDTNLSRRQKRTSNTLLTLAGFCVFLFVLCAFLLGALVYVGRQIVIEKSNRLTAGGSGATTTTGGFNLTDADGRFAYAIPKGEELNHLLLSTRPILSYNQHPTRRDPAITLNSKPTVSPSIMAASKILKQLSFRLPQELRPKNYKLFLHPDLQAKTFSGNVTIRLEVLKPISYIPVHSKFLNVTTVEVVRVTQDGDKLGDVTPALSFEYPEFEYWVTEFAQPLEVGNYALSLKFNGSLTNRIVGFYQSSYIDKEKDEKRWIATSKFEPTFARQAFPCFDEPAMKAMFRITVVRPTDDGYHALSNMPIASEIVEGNVTEVTFEDSELMSTYLACFIVSDFAFQGQTISGSLEGARDFEMRVFSTKAQVNKVKYALDIGVKITEFYIKYFGIAYPLPKLDMAAIPDFVSGAMEHWGLVTFRETALLYDEQISSSANKQRVAVVVGHELAHMWFGNLVTMKWWNDLWLNEGFASYIEYKGVNEVEPTWQMLDQFLIADLHGVMKLDATLASHPIVQTVESPSQITELFDSITYSKGASVIRMLEDLVGEENFRNATTSYLTNFYLRNAETNDYLSEFDIFGFEFDVKVIMQTWTEQMGLPCVHITRAGNTFTLTQKRFFSNPADNDGVYDDSKFNYRWTIPITYYTSEDPEVKRANFNYEDTTMTITLPSAVGWIKLNRNQVGYYRVNYPTDLWEAMTETLIDNRGKFSVSDRANLIDDAFALADAGLLEYSTALDLTKYLEKELDYVPWNVATTRLKSIRNLLYYTNYYRDFALYARQLLNPVIEAVTWNVGSDHLNNLMRVDVLNTACSFGHEEALTEAATRFNAWLSNPTERPSPDIRSTIYYYGMQVAGKDKTWQQVLDLFVAETDAQEKIKLMEALAAVKEPWILQRFINLAWNESYVRRQDYFSCLQNIAQNPIGQSLVWDYVRENWPKLVERFGINERTMGRVIPSITGRFASQTKLEEMEVFFAKYPEAGAGTAARKEAIENVKYNIAWLEQNKEKVGIWLHEQQTNLMKS